MKKVILPTFLSSVLAAGFAMPAYAHGVHDELEEIDVGEQRLNAAYFKPADKIPTPTALCEFGAVEFIAGGVSEDGNKLELLWFDDPSDAWLIEEEDSDGDSLHPNKLAGYFAPAANPDLGEPSEGGSNHLIKLDIEEWADVHEIRLKPQMYITVTDDHGVEIEKEVVDDIIWHVVPYEGIDFTGNIYGGQRDPAWPTRSGWSGAHYTSMPISDTDLRHWTIGHQLSSTGPHTGESISWLHFDEELNATKSFDEVDNEWAKAGIAINFLRIYVRKGEAGQMGEYESFKPVPGRTYTTSLDIVCYQDEPHDHIEDDF